MPSGLAVLVSMLGHVPFDHVLIVLWAGFSHRGGNYDHFLCGSFVCAIANIVIWSLEKSLICPIEKGEIMSIFFPGFCSPHLYNRTPSEYNPGLRSF